MIDAEDQYWALTAFLFNIELDHFENIFNFTKEL